MAKFRLATFNVENLFARYRFRQNLSPVGEDGFTVNDLAFNLVDETAKRITAKAIAATKADIVALQEVENLPVLDRFNSRFLASRKYRNRVLIDGNDPRAIDVGLLAKPGFDIVSIRTHRDTRRAGSPGVKLFSRDCLEATVAVPDDNGGTRSITLFVNHFKSMMGGRQDTRARREEQAQGVLDIITDRYGPNLDGDFAVIGDFNDFIDDPPKHGLGALVDHPQLVNVIAELRDEDDQWTHFFAREDSYTQLDYILLSRRLFEAAGDDLDTDIVRDGLPFRAERYDGDRFDDIGEDRPKASDHCPVVVSIPVDALSD